MIDTNQKLLSEDLNKVFKLMSKIEEIIQEIEVQFPSYEANKDIRFEQFVFIQQNITSYYYAEKLSKAIRDRSFYEDDEHLREVFKHYLQNEEKFKQFSINQSYCFGIFTKQSFFMSMFSKAETFFRVIAKSYNSGSCFNDRIIKIVQCLISDLNLDRQYLNLWNIFAYTRNTAHFGFIRTKESKSLTYKSKVFDFKKGKLLDFMHLDTVCFIIEEVLELMKRIVMSEGVAKIESIPIPYLEKE